MIYKKIYLSEINTLASKEGFIELYLYDNPSLPFLKRPAILVVPGGGYISVAPLESQNVALRYMSEGFNCFTINYAIDKKYPAPHIDLAVAVSYIRSHKEEFNLDDNLFLIGFSAGGHLVASYSYLYKELSILIKKDDCNLKPDGIILGYPVISLKKNPTYNTTCTISNYEPELFEKLSIEEHIEGDYPPTFIWTTKTDTVVNPSHTEDLIQIFEDKNVTFDYAIFDSLDHGESVVTIENKKQFSPFTRDELICKTWVDKSINFLMNIFYTKGA